MRPLARSSLFRPGLLAAALCAGSAFVSASDHAAHWGYDHGLSPAEWSGIAPACSGPQQSPIDLRSHLVRHGTRHELELEYQDTRFEVLNNGHTLQATPQSGVQNYIELAGERYSLAQFHLHTPSEHVVDGRTHAMELHLVHIHPSGKVAVVAAFFDVGEHNDVLGELFERTRGELSQPGEHVRLSAEIDPAELLPAHSRVAHYAGSLTTPPCTEGVQWSIEMNPQTLSRQQLEALRAVFPHNARPIQPLNHRRLVDEPAAP